MLYVRTIEESFPCFWILSQRHGQATTLTHRRVRNGESGVHRLTAQPGANEDLDGNDVMMALFHAAAEEDVVNFNREKTLPRLAN